MKKTINLHNFVSAFTEMGRYDQFSLDALKIIYKYITDYEEKSGQEMHLDVIAICCEFVESTPSQVIDSYDLKDENDLIAKAVDFLESKTSVLGQTETNIIYKQF